jgi:predicted RecA/RadA family phage recombinase
MLKSGRVVVFGDVMASAAQWANHMPHSSDFRVDGMICLPNEQEPKR